MDFIEYWKFILILGRNIQEVFKLSSFWLVFNKVGKASLLVLGKLEEDYQEMWELDGVESKEKHLFLDHYLHLLNNYDRKLLEDIFLQNK